jgi:hypothetical protein
MAPEQLVFGGETGPATDIFALGCVLTFAATGAHPFGSGGLEEILKRTRDAEPGLYGVPDSIRPLLSSCLDKEPGRRPAVETVLNSLRPADPAALVPPALRGELAWRAQEASALVRQVPGTAPHNVSRRRFLVVSAIGGTSLGLVAAGGTRLLQHPAASKPESRPRQPGSTSTATTAGPAPVPLWRTAIPQTAYTTWGQAELAQISGGTLVRWNSSSALGFDQATGSASWAIPSGSDPAPAVFIGVSGGTLAGVSATTSVIGGTVVGVSDTNSALLGFGPAGQTTFDVPVTQAFGGALTGLSPTQTEYASLGIIDGVAVVLVVELNGAQRSAVAAVDLAEGHVLWYRPVSWGVDAWATQSTGAPVPGGTVDNHHCYLQDGTSTLALGLRSGTVRWSAQNTGPNVLDVPTMTVENGTLIVMSATVGLALDTASGVQLWITPAPKTLAFTTGAGRLYVVTTDYDIQALDSRTGKTIWHTPNPVPDAIVDTGKVLAISVSPSLLAVSLWTTASGLVVLSAADGRPLWAYRDPVATGNAWGVQASANTVYGVSRAALYAFPASAS